MTKRTLTTFAQVERELGGVRLVATITGRSVQNVCNYRTRGYFPAVLYFVINDALRGHRCKASRALFRFEGVSEKPARRRGRRPREMLLNVANMDEPSLLEGLRKADAA